MTRESCKHSYRGADVTDLWTAERKPELPRRQEVEPGGRVVHVEEGLLAALDLNAVLLEVVFVERLVLGARERRLWVQVSADFSNVEVL
jgi:hypothetical protein